MRWKSPGTVLLIKTFLLLLLAGRPVFAEELILDAEALFERSVTRHLQYAKDRNAIELTRGVLYEDDGPAAGFSYQPNQENLGPGVLIKKDLIIPAPQAKKATLLVGRGGTLSAEINGETARLQFVGKQGNYWQAYQFSPERLKAGKNEIVLGGEGSVWIARADEFAAGSKNKRKHPNRSAKSLDGGKTWNDAALGNNNNLDGEYAVRVFLDQHQPRGRLTLGVIDAGNLAEKPIGPPVNSLGPIAIRSEATSHEKSTLQIRARTGGTFVPQQADWSDWKTIESGEDRIENPKGRYLQIEARFETENSTISPALKRLTISATPNRPTDWTENLQIETLKNPPIMRSSIPFSYEPFDRPELAELRRKFDLDDVVAGAKTEFELIQRLAAWSATRWQKMHLKEDYPPYHALEILKPHSNGTPVGGFCQQYNIVFLQACESFGLVGRLVSIGPGNRTDQIRGGHETVEIWSNEHKKWVYIDGNTAWYAVDRKTQTPLSLWELRRRQLKAFRQEPYAPVQVVKLAKTGHEWPELKSWPPFVELRLIPRSNFLEEKSPLPLNQGMRGWFWTGHFVWTDDKAPARMLYSQRIGKRANFEWTLNQAHMMLEALEPGRLRVHLDTETPGFKQFLKQTGDTETPVSQIMDWKLKPGGNELEVVPQNQAGRKGIPARIELNWKER